MATSTTWRNTVLDAAYADDTYYLSLHTGDPSTTGANEATGGSYVRQLISLASAASGSKSSDAIITFSGVPADTYTHWGLWTASTAGTFLQGGALSSSVVLASPTAVSVASGNLTFSVS